MSERSVSEGRGAMGRATMVVVALALALLIGCERAAPATSDSVAAAPATDDSDARSLATVPVSRNGAAARANAATPGNLAAREPTILFIGTSLTAGYGLEPTDAFPAVVGRMLDSAGRSAHIVNAGVSGETSAGARSRIDWVLRQPADVIVLETGANDGLRGLSVDAARDNIQTILDRIRLKQPSARVLLVQMEALPNLGARYTSEFHAMYPALAQKNHVELVPFLLEGVAGITALNQDDGIHPNRTGARIVARTVYNALVKRPLLTTATH
ncbi:MAG: arylesterase [Gemmatimonadaceae bacterium]